MLIKGAGTLIPSAQRLVWAAKQPLGNAALGAMLRLMISDHSRKQLLEKQGSLLRMLVPSLSTKLL